MTSTPEWSHGRRIAKALALSVVDPDRSCWRYRTAGFPVYRRSVRPAYRISVNVDLVVCTPRCATEKAGLLPIFVSRILRFTKTASGNPSDCSATKIFRLRWGWWSITAEACGESLRM